MNFFTDMIKAKKNIANKIDLSDSMNIAFGIDAHFALGMGVLMSSIIKNNPSATIAFHVFTDKLISDDISHLAALGRAHKILLYIFIILIIINLLHFPLFLHGPRLFIIVL
ncbi:glycosyltransferase [Pectinatus frisingensis]|uniref:glycosyltransferase n=1 Tax=Pectinatus frisingensis TaxID=865 RepID=UPI0018C4FC92|nr:glycosyltransferase [Pectinatus frisingensis]